MQAIEDRGRRAKSFYTSLHGMMVSTRLEAEAENGVQDHVGALAQAAQLQLVGLDEGDVVRLALHHQLRISTPTFDIASGRTRLCTVLVQKSAGAWKLRHTLSNGDCL